MQICDKCKTPSVYFIYSFSVTWTLTRWKTRQVLKVCRWIFMSLSPPPRPLRVVGKLGRMNWQRKRVEHNGKGKETEAPAFPSSHRPPRAFFFSSIAECIFISFYWDIHRESLQSREFRSFCAREDSTFWKSGLFCSMLWFWRWFLVMFVCLLF